MTHIRERLRQKWWPLFQHDRPLLARSASRIGTGSNLVTSEACLLTYACITNTAGTGSAGVGTVRQGSTTGNIVWIGTAPNLSAGTSQARGEMNLSGAYVWCPHGIALEVSGSSTVLVVHYVLARDIPWLRNRALFKDYNAIESVRKAGDALYVSEEFEPPPGGGGSDGPGITFGGTGGSGSGTGAGGIS